MTSFSDRGEVEFSFLREFLHQSQVINKMIRFLVPPLIIQSYPQSMDHKSAKQREIAKKSVK